MKSSIWPVHAGRFPRDVLGHVTSPKRWTLEGSNNLQPWYRYFYCYYDIFFFFFSIAM